MKQRNRLIPDTKIGFYGVGLYDVSEDSKRELEKLIAPIRDLVIPKISLNPVHISCRYLGYYDEVTPTELQEARKRTRAILNPLLPLSLETGSLFAGWHKHPDYKPRLIMMNVEDATLFQLHQKLVEVTDKMQMFTAIEGENFHPHITLAALKPEFENQVPSEIEDYIVGTNEKLRLTFNGAFFWGPQGPEPI